LLKIQGIWALSSPPDPLAYTSFASWLRRCNLQPDARIILHIFALFIKLNLVMTPNHRLQAPLRSITETIGSELQTIHN